MDPATALLVGGGISAGGSLLSSAFGLGMGQHNFNEEMRWSREQFERSMAFQERMSNTAHQREVADLMKAGLNPILSATGGHGASSGGGLSSSMPGQPSMKSDLDLSGVGRGVSSAVEYKLNKRRLEIEADKAAAEVEERKASAVEKVSDARLKDALVGEIGPRIGLLGADTDLRRKQLEEVLGRIELYKAESNQKVWDAKYLESRIPQQEALNSFAEFIRGIMGGREGGQEAARNINKLLEKMENWEPPRFPTTGDMWEKVKEILRGAVRPSSDKAGDGAQYHGPNSALRVLQGLEARKPQGRW